MRRLGFTLVELLIVIIIIAVLAAVVVPKFTSSTQRARETSLKQLLRDTRVAIERFRANTNLYPSSLSDLTLKVAPTTGLSPAGNTAAIGSKYDGPYMDVIPLDPISGNPLTYNTVAPNVGKVKASAAGIASDGTAYSTW